MTTRNPSAAHGPRGLAPIVLGALGVVYGDIGTSPLYALRQSFGDADEFPVSPTNVLGILSLIVWSLILVVTIKYVLLIMRADNRGEGGILALMALVSRVVRVRPRLQAPVLAAGLAGVALFLGDSALTPAISVLSAVEGLEVATAYFKPYVVPIAIAVLLALFLIQSRGTAALGHLFGPVMLVWFGVLGVMGVLEIFKTPEVLYAFDPRYAVEFVRVHGWGIMVALGAVVLSVTGAEVLYADMGHFGRRAIRVAWSVVVLPGLLANYLGQGALILRVPAAASNPFFQMVPEEFLYPLVALATVATVVASQAVISGAFSVVNQGIQLGFLPRLEIRHTSAAARGQIYLPKVNWCLLAAVLVLTVGFGSSEHLGAAYGVAVVGTMALTTLMAALVAVYLWRWPRALVILAFGLLLAVDLAFLVSNTLKIGSGGWAPLLASGVVLGLMWAWVRGRRILYGVLADQGMSIDSLLDLISSSRITRVPGSAVYLARAGENVPHALLHNLKHNKVLHERVLLLTVKTENVPSVPAPERAEFVQLGNGIFRSTLHYGFQETPDVPRDLALLDRPEFPFDPSAVSYMVGRVNVVAGDRPRLPRWQRRVFLIATHNALSAPDFYRLPPNQVVELGAQVSI